MGIPLSLTWLLGKSSLGGTEQARWSRLSGTDILDQIYECSGLIVRGDIHISKWLLFHMYFISASMHTNVLAITLKYSGCWKSHLISPRGSDILFLIVFHCNFYGESN